MVINPLINNITLIQAETMISSVISVSKNYITLELLESYMHLGTRVSVKNKHNEHHLCEIVTLEKDRAIAMPFNDLNGVSQGDKVYILHNDATIYPDDSWLGRIIDALGDPLDKKDKLNKGTHAYHTHAQAPDAISRKKINTQIITGIRSIDTFLSISQGQRMGVFASAGTGKSSLLRMLTYSIQCDVVIVALIGERGRELNDFIDIALKNNKNERTTIVMASSDSSALMKCEAVAMAMTLSEYHRDKGRHVLLIIDSLTRYAHALRDIAITSGEPPSSRGYCPSVFSTLPKILERAGRSDSEGSITGIFSVLIDTEDTTDPLEEVVKSILDGHLLLNHEMAQSGIYPAIDILNSISRISIDLDEEQKHVINLSRHYLSIYDEMKDMIRMGAYQSGHDIETDKAIKFYEALKQFIHQDMYEITELEQSQSMLAQILYSITSKTSQKEISIP